MSVTPGKTAKPGRALFGGMSDGTGDVAQAYNQVSQQVQARFANAGIDKEAVASAIRWARAK